MDVCRITICYGVAACLFALLAGESNGHEGAGLATIDQRVKIVAGAQGLQIEYVAELNRPAAFAEVAKIDTDGDGQLTSSEQSRYFSALAETHRHGLEVLVNGRPVALKQVGEVQLAMPFRKTYRYRTSHPDSWQDGAVVEVHNENYLDHDGRLTLSVRPDDAVDVVYDSLAAERDGGPTATNSDIAEPLHQRDLVFCYRAGSGGYHPTRSPPSIDSALMSEASQLGERRRWMFLASTLAGVCLVAGVLGFRHFLSGRVSRACAVMLALFVAGVGTAGLLPPEHNTAAELSEALAARRFAILHRDIYRAFDEQTESGAYDRLAESLAGDALSQTYNEVIRTVLVREDGASFHVRRVKPITTTVLPPAESHSPSHFRVRHCWRVYGTVTHFAHTHARVNEYEAIFTVACHDDAWRITNVDMRQHKRLSTERVRNVRDPKNLEG